MLQLKRNCSEATLAATRAQSTATAAALDASPDEMSGDHVSWCEADSLSPIFMPCRGERGKKAFEFNRSVQRRKPSIARTQYKQQKRRARIFAYKCTYIVASVRRSGSANIPSAIRFVLWPFFGLIVLPLANRRAFVTFGQNMVIS